MKAFFSKSGKGLIRNRQIFTILIVVFYMVGLAGMLNPATFSFFTRLVPLALILSFVVLAHFHEGKVTVKAGLLFGFIVLAGFFIEVVGVKTGVLFGQYAYGESLGLKILETPLIIGLNWLLLAYMTSGLTEKLKINVLMRIPAAAAMMVVYDLVLERVAPLLDMWYWAGDQVPLRNYAAWFIISLVFVALLRIFRIPTRNPLSLTIFLVQFFFFLILTFFI